MCEYYLFSVDAVCKPFLKGPVSPVCPSDAETVTFTCEDSQVNNVQWMALPYILETDPIVLVLSSEKEIVRSNFKAILTNVTNTNDTQQVADLTSTLTVPINGISTETVVMCWTTRGVGEGFKKNSTTLMIAGRVIQMLNLYYQVYSHI